MSELEQEGNGKTSAEAVDEQGSLAESDQALMGEAAEQLQALVEERDRLASEKAELRDMLVRRQADHENFRRRAERERGEVYDLAAMDTVGTLLPVLDDFERALKATSAEEDPALRDYATGMKLIYQRLYDALKRMGLEPVEAEGKTFDPNLHHAVQREEREDCEDHTVIEELQRGYHFKGRLLRAAMVKVSVRP